MEELTCDQHTKGISWPCTSALSPKSAHWRCSSTHISDVSGRQVSEPCSRPGTPGPPHHIQEVDSLVPVQFNGHVRISSRLLVYSRNVDYTRDSLDVACVSQANARHFSTTSIAENPTLKHRLSQLALHAARLPYSGPLEPDAYMPSTSSRSLDEQRAKLEGACEGSRGAVLQYIYRIGMSQCAKGIRRNKPV